MRELSKISLWAGIVAAIIGGISRLTLAPIILPSRAWAGASVIMLLFSIAISVQPKE